MLEQSRGIGGLGNIRHAQEHSILSLDKLKIVKKPGLGPVLGAAAAGVVEYHRSGSAGKAVFVGTVSGLCGWGGAALGGLISGPFAPVGLFIGGGAGFYAGEAIAKLFVD